jgi:hypothetical protein
VKPQLVPSQVTVALWEGTGQGEQLAPHEFTLLLPAHSPLQSWVMAGHTPVQASPMGMQTPAQSFCPPGQVPPHCVPLQVALPPVGGRQGEQEIPQVAGSELLAQAAPHA